MTGIHTEILGNCEKMQYEHAGPHAQIIELGQVTPPFSCKNWKPVDAPKVADAGVVPHEFSCPDGELDEVFIANAFVHIERMGDTAFWIGIEGENKPMLHLNTGVHRGQWYFNIEVDSNDEPHWLAVQRPRKGSAPPPSRRPHDVERITALEAENRQLKEQVRKLTEGK